MELAQRGVLVLGMSVLTFSAGAACGPRKPTPSVGGGAPQAALACDAQVIPPPQSQFPPGYDYPQATQPWVDQRQGDRTRLHAWCLFAGLNSTAVGTTKPVWKTWGNSTQAFPLQYNPWPASTPGPSGAALERPAPLNAKNRSNAKVGASGEEGAINFAGPVYGVNQDIVNNPAYQGCLQKMSSPGPALYQLKDGAQFQSNGDIMVAGVTYNQAALDAILQRNLFDASVLNRSLPPQPGSPATSMAPMPPESVVLKPMLWPVAKGSYTALPIWDWDAHPPGSAADGQYAGYEMQQFWSRAVAVTDLPDPRLPPQVSFLYGVLDAAYKPLGPNTYRATPQLAPPPLQVVGVDRFYRLQFTQAELDAMMQQSPCDRAILDASAYWAYNRAFAAGDSLVLVAMHMMTKEQDTWTFQSAWWHPDALACKDDRFCGNRPGNLSDQTFANYMMTTTYGMTQKKGNPNYYAPPSTKGEVWPVAFNPYIELAAAHPITTNCMNCHHRAAWPPRVELGKQDGGRASLYLQASPANPNALETFDFTNPVFSGLTMMDSMWAISDRAGFPTSTSASTKR